MELAAREAVVVRDALVAQDRVDADDEVPVGVAEVIAVELEADGQHVVEHAQRVEGTQRVARLVDADAVDLGVGLDLDDLDVDAALCERRRGAQPADPAADDQRPLDRRHQWTLDAAQGFRSPRSVSSGGAASSMDSGIATLR